MNVTVLREQVTMRDETLPHQIVLLFTRGGQPQTDLIGVSCNCLRTVRPAGGGSARYQTLAARTRWDDPGEPMRIWRDHMTTITKGATA